jgi:hypothetical protein
MDIVFLNDFYLGGKVTMDGCTGLKESYWKIRNHTFTTTTTIGTDSGFMDDISSLPALA